MKLYGAIVSPYVVRVLMFARLKGLEPEHADMPGSPSSDAYRALNPIGKIPCMEIDGLVIPESEVICEYLEDAFPQISGLPADPLDRATSRTVSRIIDLYIAPFHSRIIRQVNPATRDADVVADAKANLEKGIVYLEHFMSSGPFAAGEVPTLGDCAAGPYMLLLKKATFACFDGFADPTASGRLAEWWQALQGHDVCKATLDEYEAAIDGFLPYLLKQIGK